MPLVRTAFAVIAMVTLGGLGAFAYTKLIVGEKPVMRMLPQEEAVVMRTRGGVLEVTTVTAVESFVTSQDHSILGVTLGRTVARIRVPAVYRYHIELAPEWKVLVRNNTFLVIAPAVKPSLPVAIDTARLEAESSGRWSLLTGGPVVEQLQRSITKALEERALSPKNIELQREFARQTVSEFVKKWLITQERWKSASTHPVHVFFADEQIAELRKLPPSFLGGL